MSTTIGICIYFFISFIAFLKYAEFILSLSSSHELLTADILTRENADLKLTEQTGGNAVGIFGEQLLFDFFDLPEDTQESDTELPPTPTPYPFPTLFDDDPYFT